MTRKRPLAGRKQRKTRINAKVRKLLQHLVLDGWTLEKSATECGWTLDWAIRLLRRPDVLALRKELLSGVLSASASRAGKTIDQILSDAKSDAVRLDAAQFVLGVEGIAPVERAEVTHHNSGVTPGLVIIFSSRAPATLDITPEFERQRAQLLASLPPSVPHPTMGPFTGATLVKREDDR